MVDVIDTAEYLVEFKAKYLEPIKKANEKYMSFKELPPAEAVKADKIKSQYIFLSNFVASVEATLEENFTLKQK